MKKFTRKSIVALVSCLCLAASPVCAKDGEDTPELRVEINPRFDYVTVDGDAQKFRQDQWMDNDATGGVESFKLHYQLAPDTSLEAEARAILLENNYKAHLRIDKKNFGYFKADFTEFRDYFDSTGGFFPLFSQTYFELDKDLYLDIGDLNFEAGLTLPNWPKLVIGYEHSFKNGEKSLLEWGDVSEGNFTRSIYPSYKDIDERVDTVRAEVDHNIGKIHLADKFRYEHYHSDTTRHDRSLDLTAGTSQSVDVYQSYNHDAFYNTFYTDSWVRDNVYLSLGYLYTNLDGTASFSMNTVPFGSSFDKNWYANSIDVSNNGHVGNLNALLGPFKGFTLYGGLEGEMSDKDGSTDAVYPEIGFTGNFSAPNGITVSDRDQWGLQETLGVRYKGLPYTTIYAEGKWTQQDYDLTESELEAGSLALNLKQNASVNWQRYSIGFNSSPFSRTTFSVRYRYSYRDNDYDNKIDDTPNAYPGFITSQNFTTNDVTARVTVRLMRRLQASLEYQYIGSEIDTSTETIPPSSVQSGNYNANVYSASITVTPISRLFITEMFSYRDARMRTYNNVPSVESYDADYFQAITSAALAIDDKTDLRAQYLFSYTANFKNFYQEGLPLGLDNHRHALLTSLNRRINKNLSLQLRYGFYKYSEPSNGGADDYTANLFGVGLKMKF